jgi:hypothetical protein
MTRVTNASMARSTIEHGHLPFAEIQASGCYVSLNTGDLYRISAEALASRGSPLIKIVSKTGSLMTKIADDPWVPINEARRLCADADLHPNF